MSRAIIHTHETGSDPGRCFILKHGEDEWCFLIVGNASCEIMPDFAEVRYSGNACPK